MNLTLEVVSPNARDLGASRLKVFGVEGGRIGRAPECDWVLPNPYVSRHHATVRWISGKFYIESTNDNGVGIGSAQALLPRLERRALNPGDRIFLDEYEIAVAIVGATSEGLQPAFGGDASASFIPSDDPFAAAPAVQARSNGLVADPFEPSSEDLDPLNQLTGSFPTSTASPTAPRHDAAWNHTPSLSDQFAPPPVPSSGGIPDDWDSTSFGRAQAAPAASAAGGIPDDWDKTTFGRSKAQPAQIQPAASYVSQPASPPGPRASAARILAPQAGPQPRPAPSMPPVQAMPAPGGAAPVQQLSVPAGALDLTTLLRNAGVDPATVPPETAVALGAILRSVVQGVIEVLQARAEIKTQFRLPVTRVKTAENNPLKFAVNAEDALASLFGRRNPGYLGPTEAFDDAFQDIRFHQLAMLAGMQAGFESVMGCFDPQKLEEEFEKHGKRGGLLSSKSRCWEMYAERFEKLGGDREAAFRRLFGEEFSSAYEKQLDMLKRSHRQHRR